MVYLLASHTSLCLLIKAHAVAPIDHSNKWYPVSFKISMGKSVSDFPSEEEE